MDALLEALPRYANEQLYFDPPQNSVIHEQQLSGHSWFLRGLCEHYEQFGDALSLTALKSVTEHLYLPTAGKAQLCLQSEKLRRGSRNIQRMKSGEKIFRHTNPHSKH